MTKGELIQYMNEFIAEQDDDEKCESYDTARGDAEFVISNFRSWLIRKGVL